jgi:hypothetical protein
MKKKVIFFVIIGVLAEILIVGGIALKIRSNNPYVKMIKYMNQKYPSDTFTYKGPWGGGIGVKNGAKECLLESANYPNTGINEDVWVKYYVDNNGQENYYDNYLSVKYHEQM